VTRDFYLWRTLIVGTVSILAFVGWLRRLHRDRSLRQMSVSELEAVLNDPTARLDYRMVLSKLQTQGHRIDSAIPIIAQMMLSEDLGNRRIGKSLLREFFPEILAGVRYNWLLPSRAARQALLDLLYMRREQHPAQAAVPVLEYATTGARQPKRLSLILLCVSGAMIAAMPVVGTVCGTLLRRNLPDWLAMTLLASFFIGISVLVLASIVKRIEGP
jgi:hypothetical protein